MLDNALELLVRGPASDLAEAVSLLVPPPWQNDPRHLLRRSATSTGTGRAVSEPWDGPAALCFTDGRRSRARRSTATGSARCGRRDRRRPRRGRVRGRRRAAARGHPRAPRTLGPGGILAVDPERGLLVDGELSAELARRRPYGEWVAASTIDASHVGEPMHPPEDELERGTSCTATRART